MSTISCTRRLTFCAGHRVLGHENKCAHIHGHNYVVEATAVGNTGVDALGRVIDFSIIKQYLGGWLDVNLDHGFIVNKEDAAVLDRLQDFEVRPATNDSGIVLPACRQKVYVLQDNPTAENIARHLLLAICPQLFVGSGVRITKIRLHETENCYADAEL